MWALIAPGHLFVQGTRKHDAAPAETKVSAGATVGVSPIFVCNLSRQFFGLFRSAARGTGRTNLQQPHP